MSDENKAVLTRANAAVSTGDYEGFLSHCTDDVVWDFVGDRVLGGKAAVRAYMRATYVEPPRFRVDRLIAEGEYVTAVGEIELPDDAGKLVRYAYCDVWRVRDGRLAELRAFVVKIGAAA
ncbi:MAG TPA: nuclear transport factor 2 family protein [Tepidisphaeraceae bacterium]|nr:nuclear transport factor 2 family protein [Tepidisphaeraceae bacterium]